MEDLFDNEFWHAVRTAQNNGQRKGQAVFNSAWDFWPREAQQLTGTPSDCFYADDRVPRFLEHLADLLTR